MLLSFGINDCEAKIARMPMADVWEIMRPLAGESDVCIGDGRHNGDSVTKQGKGSASSGCNGCSDGGGGRYIK